MSGELIVITGILVFPELSQYKSEESLHDLWGEERIKETYILHSLLLMLNNELLSSY